MAGCTSFSPPDLAPVCEVHEINCLASRWAMGCDSVQIEKQSYSFDPQIAKTASGRKAVPNRFKGHVSTASKLTALSEAYAS
jgi:hypothetical protein